MNKSVQQLNWTPRLAQSAKSKHIIIIIIIIIITIILYPDHIINKFHSRSITD